MLSNKVKRNIWLALSIGSVAVMIGRAIQVAMGETEWWQLFSVAIITGFCIKFYRCYRKQVKEGHLFSPSQRTNQ